MDLLQLYAKFLANGGLIPYALQGLDYLRRSVLGSPPTTTGTGTPYTPPFIGGQCSTLYTLNVTAKQISNGQRISFGNQFVNGPVQSITPFTNNPTLGNGITIRAAGVDTVVNGNAAFFEDFRAENPIRYDGQPDNCGNVPNPNPTPPISSDGIATSDPPDFSGAAVNGIVTGTALAADGTAAAGEDGQDDFTDAGALAPTDIAGAIGKIAAGLSKVLFLLQKINELIDLLKKLFNKDNKSSFSYNFGNLRYDGFIRLQSEPPTASITPLYLDLQATAIKVGASKYFGEKSPNYYNREPIGYIHFVSPTFGVLSTHEIRFSRTSIPIPSLAYGFFYHMGLDGVNRANATGFYLKQEE